jgi:hypothetical protein
VKEVRCPKDQEDDGKPRPTIDKKKEAKLPKLTGQRSMSSIHDEDEGRREVKEHVAQAELRSMDVIRKGGRQVSR